MKQKLSITALVTISFFLLFIGVRSTGLAKSSQQNQQPRAVAEFELKASLQMCDSLPEVAEPVGPVFIPSVVPHEFSPDRRTLPSLVITVALKTSRAPPLASVESV